MEIKNGKKPLSAKPAPARLTLDDIFGNTLSIPQDVQKHLEAKGLVGRWISYPKFVAMGGSHDRAWRPIKAKDCGMISSSPIDGSDAEGYLRRGDLVLAVRSKEINDKHKAYLRQEAQRSSNAQKQRDAAEELRQFAKDMGVGIKVSEGYDDN